MTKNLKAGDLIYWSADPQKRISLFVEENDLTGEVKLFSLGEKRIFTTRYLQTTIKLSYDHDRRHRHQ